MLPFQASLKPKPWREHFFRRTTFFSPQIKKSPDLHRQRELNWAFLSIFSKRNIFLHFQTIFFFFFFFDFFSQLFMEWDTFESNSVSFFLSCSLQPTNCCFVSLKKISDGDLQTILHPSMNYWLQYWDLHYALVECKRPAQECTKNLGDTFHCRHVFHHSIRWKFSYAFSLILFSLL